MNEFATHWSIFLDDYNPIPELKMFNQAELDLLLRSQSRVAKVSNSISPIGNLKMFNESELNLLIRLQYCDDWHPYYFQHLVKNSGSDRLVTYVQSLSFDQVQSLQLALDLLAVLPLIKESVPSHV